MQKKITLKILSQSFYPDIVATGELLYELAVKLVEDYDVNVSVITAQPNFVKKDKLERKSILNGIKVRRLNISCFNKNKLSGKILNSWIFFFRAFFEICCSPNTNWLLIPTSPPLLPLLGVFAKLFKKQKYIYLMHDVYPEIAAKLGYIKQDGIIYKIWAILTKLSIKFADNVVVLSDNMKEYVSALANVPNDKITVIHNWANEDIIKIIPKEENYFIDKFNLRNKFIIEYSGNIGKIHEFQTLLDTAYKIKDHNDIVFLFIGTGGKKQELVKFKEKHNLDNIVFLPYQERKDLTYSFGMADVHVLSLLEGYKHLAAPSKFYGILASGKPVLFIGDNQCYIKNIIETNQCGYHIDSEDSEKLRDIILEFKNSPEKLDIYGKNSKNIYENNYTLRKISEEYYKIITGEETLINVTRLVKNISSVTNEVTEVIETDKHLEEREVDITKN